MTRPSSLDKSGTAPVQPLPREGSGSWLTSLKRLSGGERADDRRATPWPAAFLSGLEGPPGDRNGHSRPHGNGPSTGHGGSHPNGDGAARAAPEEATHPTASRTTVPMQAASEQALKDFSQRSGFPIADLSACSSQAVALVPEQVARRYQIVPLRATDGCLEIATANPYDIDCENTLAFATSREIRMSLATPEAIAQKLDELYRPESLIDQLLQGIDGPAAQVTEIHEETDTAELNAWSSEASTGPVVRLVDHLLAEGIRSRASDIHIEPEQGGIAVRYRIDGVLRQVMALPRRVGLPLISRIKIMSRLDIADRLRPQDGRARVAVGGVPVDLRVSTLPAAGGEKVVLRILDSSATVLSLDAMGLNPDESEAVKDLLSNRDGVILVTGPTGSGKTTTLYSAIRHVQSEGVNIITVEDPVEYRLKGIVQVQVHDKAGLTFASALRSILRQDPDVVLVGEVRDRETAQIAVQASLTGHLVLSTLHTNDAPSAVTRLLDIGVEGYKIATALRGVIAQRLMRRLCSTCKDVSLEPIPRKLHGWVPPDATLYRPVGCPKCAMTGYRGRLAIMEVLRVTPEVERAIAGGAPADQVAAAARRAGMHTLWESGLSHVLRGESTVDELLRVVDVPDETERPPQEAPAEPAAAPDPPAAPGPEMLRSAQSPEGTNRESAKQGEPHLSASISDGTPGTVELRLEGSTGVRSVKVPSDVKVMVVVVEAPQGGRHHRGQESAGHQAGASAPAAHDRPAPHYHDHAAAHHAEPQPRWSPPPVYTPPLAAQYSHAVFYQPTPLAGMYPGVFQYAPAYAPQPPQPQAPWGAPGPAPYPPPYPSAPLGHPGQAGGHGGGGWSGAPAEPPHAAAHGPAYTASPHGAPPNGASAGAHSNGYANGGGSPYTHGAYHPPPANGGGPYANGTAYHAPPANGGGPYANGGFHPSPTPHDIQEHVRSHSGPPPANGSSGFRSAPANGGSGGRQERRGGQRRRLTLWGFSVDRRSGGDRRAASDRRRTVDRRRVSEPVAFERRSGRDRRGTRDRRSGLERRCGFERRMMPERRR